MSGPHIPVNYPIPDESGDDGHQETAEQTMAPDGDNASSGTGLGDQGSKPAGPLLAPVDTGNTDHSIGIAFTPAAPQDARTPSTLDFDNSKTQRVIQLLNSPSRATTDMKMEEIKRRLRRKGSVYRGDYWGWTPLHVAAYGGRLLEVKALIELGAAVNVMNMNNQTPLDLAVLMRHKDIERVLRRAQ